MTEPTQDLKAISSLVGDAKFQNAIADFVGRIPDLAEYLAEHGFQIPDGSTITIEQSMPPKPSPPKPSPPKPEPPKKCWKICVGRPPFEICYEHCSG